MAAAASTQKSGYNFAKAKVAVVTGGGSGIGRAICLSLARRAVAHIFVADIDEEGANETVKQIEALGLGIKAKAVKSDIGSEKGVNSLIDEAEAAGPVDCFFANAGIAGGAWLKGCDPAYLQKMNEINVYQSVYAARRLLPDLAHRGGCFAVTSSAAGLMTQIGSLAYTITKHAVRSLAEWLSITYGDAGLHVVCLCPQAVESKMTAKGSAVAGLDGILPAEAASESVCKSLEAGKFYALPHPIVGEYVKRKANDIDRWLAGMRRSQAQIMGDELRANL